MPHVVKLQAQPLIGLPAEVSVAGRAGAHAGRRPGKGFFKAATKPRLFLSLLQDRVGLGIDISSWPEKV
jgi:hypothetical protein